MTNVVAFQARRKRATAAPEGPFQLLFFTGVRYVREAVPKKNKSQKAARNSRKRLA